MIILNNEAFFMIILLLSEYGYCLLFKLNISVTSIQFLTTKKFNSTFFFINSTYYYIKITYVIEIKN